MENNQRKVILYIAMSLDGYIAANDGDISFLSVVEKPGEDYGYTKFNEGVDTMILGRKTYDKILSMGVEKPYPGKMVYVLSRTERTVNANLQFYSGGLRELIEQLKAESGKHIYCDGGAETVLRLLRENLIDELIVSIIPVLLGDGIPLFKPGFPEKKLRLIRAETFDTGLVQLHYERRKE